MQCGGNMAGGGKEQALARIIERVVGATSGEFVAVTDEKAVAQLTREQIQAYDQEHDEFRAKVEPYLYALRLEAQTLQQYAQRSGIETRVSFTGSADTDRAAVEAFAYETASLILSRILMIRFSEDHGLMARYISNGGVAVFAGYAQYFRAGYQELLKLTYENARELYRGLFGGTSSGAAQALVKGIRGYRARRESQAERECSEILRKAYSMNYRDVEQRRTLPVKGARRVCARA